MRLPGGLHYSYCMNVHPGVHLVDQVEALQQVVPHVKGRLCSDQPFGLGLRLSREAATELREAPILDFFRQELLRAGTYAFTVNAFPYGAFHQTRVKEQVYAPDWLTPERLAYTCEVCEILAGLLPEGVEGSVSTVPLTYGGWKERSGDLCAFAQPLGELARFLEDLEKKTGRLVHVGLEPEPDCALQTTAETIRWFEEVFFRAGSAEVSRRRYVGVCFDTCHVAMQFEEPVEMLRAYSAAGIRVSKVQLSAALELDADSDLSALRAFDDGVYLHQVKSSTGQSWPDLPALFDSDVIPEGVLRVHCHVPMHWKGQGALRSTVSTLGPEFAAALTDSGCRHVEVETYTFDVLPESVRKETLPENLIRECGAGLAILGLA